MSLSFLFSCSSTRHNKNNKERMRIADVLSEEEEEEEAEVRRTRRRGVLQKASSFSSRSVTMLSRWFTKKKLAGPGSLPIPVEPDKEVSASAATGAKREELSFNLGMGMSLVFLLAKSAAEANKMFELRAQMEMLLKEVRTEIRRKDAISSSLESSNSVSDSITSSFESSNNISISPSKCCGNADICSASYYLEGVKHAAVLESESNYVTAGNTRSVSLDQMEAELELELEQLETNLEGESSSAHQHREELSNEKDDPSFESFSGTYEEEDKIPQDIHENNGVSAHELERRLHELLATRQREQITELQSRLECMEQKLHEKDFELCLWKQTKCVDLQNEGASPHSSEH